MVFTFGFELGNLLFCSLPSLFCSLLSLYLCQKAITYLFVSIPGLGP